MNEKFMTKLQSTQTYPKEMPAKLVVKCIENIQEASAELDRITKRTTGSTQEEAEKTVKEILNKIKNLGDTALIEYTKRFDGFSPEPLQIHKKLLVNAWEKTPSQLQEALKTAKQRIEDFHKLQIPQDISIKGAYGEHLGRRWLPVEKAGIYIPGGRAAYPSTVLMNAIPAKVAGVKEIYVTVPCVGKKINPGVLYAAQ